MADQLNIPLKIIDGTELPERYREVLRPGEVLTDTSGTAYTLPRYFYEIDSEDTANSVKLAQHFYVREFIQTDFKEDRLLQAYPKYIPLAIAYTASLLELFRKKVSSIVRIAANGGYRSPRHQTNNGITPHSWGTAVNIYKIGSNFVDSESSMEKYHQIVHEVLPGVWVRPYGKTPGHVYDQIHLDLGYTTVFPKTITS